MHRVPTMAYIKSIKLCRRQSWGLEARSTHFNREEHMVIISILATPLNQPIAWDSDLTIQCLWTFPCLSAIKERITGNMVQRQCIHRRWQNWVLTIENLNQGCTSSSPHLHLIRYHPPSPLTFRKSSVFESETAFMELASCGNVACMAWATILGLSSPERS